MVVISDERIVLLRSDGRVPVTAVGFGAGDGVPLARWASEAGGGGGDDAGFASLADVGDG